MLYRLRLMVILSIFTFKNSLQSFLPISFFESQPSNDSALSCFNGNTQNDWPWSKFKGIVDKVHHPICGHASLMEIRLLLKRNNTWYNTVDDYIHQFIENCTSCKAIPPLQSSRKVSISSPSRKFYEVFCINHFYLDEVVLLYYMHMVTRFYPAYDLSSAAINEAIFGFESCWLQTSFCYQSLCKGTKHLIL